MLVTVHKIPKYSNMANLLASFIHTIGYVSRVTKFCTNKMTMNEFLCSHHISFHAKRTHCIALLAKCLDIFHVKKTSGIVTNKYVKVSYNCSSTKRIQCMNSWILWKIAWKHVNRHFFTDIFHFIWMNECIWKKIEENHSEGTPKTFQFCFISFACTVEYRLERH